MSRVLTGLLLAACLVAVVACEPTTDSSSIDDGFYATATAERDRIAVSVRALGQVEPLASRTLTFGTVSGRVTEVLVHEGDHVAEGQPLVRLDTEELEGLLLEAEADLRVAEAELDLAQKVASEAELTAAEAAVVQAEAELAEAKLAWELAKEAPLAAPENEVADATYALQAARDQLALDEIQVGQPDIRRLEYEQAFFQRALRDLQAKEDRAELEENLAQVSSKLARARASREATLLERRKAVAEAEDALQKARTELERAQDGSVDPTAELQLAYERARESLAEAQEELAALQAGPDPDALERASNAYDAALAKVEDVQASIEAATLLSPIDGAVLTLFVAPSDWVSASSNVAYVADVAELDITAWVSEQDVVLLEPGQEARVSFATAPHTMYAGELVSVASRAETQDGMAMFKVVARLEDVDVEVLPGMTANLWIDVGEQDDVLVVPVTAVQRDNAGDTILMVRDDELGWVERDVLLGMSDGLMIEVVDGLREGEVVRIPLQSPGTQQGQG
ncbi:MAG: efflux RND transporter periplasmic adaptor subunit [Anaerolineae bacterium]